MRWIIGDVHGMLRSLEALLKEVSRVDSGARFFFAGDYVNRGPDSRGVVDLLLSLRDARFIRGNHDDIFDHVLNGTCYAAEEKEEADPLFSFQWFMHHGLDATFASYGVDSAEIEFCNHRPSMRQLDRITAQVPESHKLFFRNLPALIEEPDLFVVHAKWDPDEADSRPAMAQQLERSFPARYEALWGRFSEDEIQRTKAWSRTGYFGHTPVYVYAASQRTGELLVRPIAGPKIVLLDTGVALSESGRLTAYCPDEQVFVQADRFGRVVEG
jgi:serine/threonine protein phosphatase 1